jgi:uncharacterized protein YcfJ
MKLKLALLSLVIGSSVQAAQSESFTVYGRVLSSIAISEQIEVNDDPVCVKTSTVIQKNSHANKEANIGLGTVLGGIAGGALGNQVGGGNGKTLATVAGIVGGGLLGNKLDNKEAPAVEPSTATSEKCTVRTRYVNQPVGYEVTYEYAGQKRKVITKSAPTSRIELQITPVL